MQPLQKFLKDLRNTGKYLNYGIVKFLFKPITYQRELKIYAQTKFYTRKIDPGSRTGGLGKGAKEKFKKREEVELTRKEISA